MVQAAIFVSVGDSDALSTFKPKTHIAIPLWTAPRWADSAIFGFAKVWMKAPFRNPRRNRIVPLMSQYRTLIFSNRAILTFGIKEFHEGASDILPLALFGVK